MQRITWLVSSAGAIVLMWSACGGDTTIADTQAVASGPASGTATGGSTSTQQGAGAGGSGTSAGGSTSTSSAVGGAAPCGSDPIPPGSSACPSQCTSCTAENVCLIDCTGASVCDALDIIDCPPDYACQIICDGPDSCDTTTVNCDSMYACSVTCQGGIDACGDLRLVCGGGPCYLSCEGDACVGAQMECGAGYCSATCIMPNPPPTVNCNNACQCIQCM